VTLAERILADHVDGLGSISRGRVAIEFTWVVLGELVGLVGLAVNVRLLTAIMTPTAYGELALGLSLATLPAQTIVGPLGSAAERFFASYAEHRRLPELLHGVFRLTTGASALTCVGGFAFAGLCALTGSPQWVPLVLAASAFAVLSGWERILDGIQNAARARAIVAWHQGLRQWLRPAAAAVVLRLYSSTSSVALAGFAIASLGVLASQALLFRAQLADSAYSHLDRTAIDETHRRLLRYAGPFALWGIFTWLQLSSDRWALQWLSSPESVGLYAALFQVGISPLYLFGAVLSQLAGPIIFARAGDGSNPVRLAAAFQLIILFALCMLGLTVLMVIGTALLHVQVFAILVGPAFQSVSQLLPIAVLTGGLFSVGQILSMVPLASGDSRVLLAPKIGTALLAVPLYLAGAQVAGAQGVLVGGAVFAASFAVWTAVIAALVVGRRSVVR
jgi:O-antigen/teichoic acid export membrane protein